METTLIHDMAEFLAELESTALFPGKGRAHRGKIAELLTRATGEEHVLDERKMRVVKVVRA